MVRSDFSVAEQDVVGAKCRWDGVFHRREGRGRPTLGLPDRVAGTLRSVRRGKILEHVKESFRSACLAQFIAFRQDLARKIDDRYNVSSLSGIAPKLHSRYSFRIDLLDEDAKLAAC